MFTVAIVLTSKHLGIALVFICGLVIFWNRRKALSVFVSGWNVTRFVVKGFCESLPVLGIELLSAGIVFGIFLIGGAPLGVAFAVGVIFGIVAMLTMSPW